MAAPLSFFPLGAARTVPSVATVTRPNHKHSGPGKRSLPSSASSSPTKKRAVSDSHKSHQKPHALPVKVAQPRFDLTPQPSSDAPSEGFKVPALPARLAPLTPTTSTVAASSSPGRRMAALSSSPTRALLQQRPAPPVRLEAGTTLIFGRHHVRGRRNSVGPVPASLVDKLAIPSNPARTVILSREAKHASRVHAAAELVPSTTTSRSFIRLLVLGQNGLRVRPPGGKFRRLTPGTTRAFPADTVIEVDFYGTAVTLRAFEDPDETDDERLFTPEPEPAEPVCAPSPLSLPPSSPPREMGMPFESEEEDEREILIPGSDEAAPTPYAVRVAPREQHHERSSSPLSEPEEDAVSDRAPTPPVLATSITVKQELLEAAATVAVTEPPKPSTPAATSTPTPASPSGPTTAPATARAKSPNPIKSRAHTPQAPIPEIPAGLDLAAILASTVVFSGSSKLSLPDLVKALLESQPAMREHGDATTWAAWAGKELEANDMFGKITRNGRDSSGRPLEPHYFYNPAADPDPARARELGGLVRPLRATQRGGGKAIDWRPVGSGRRKYW